MNRRWGVIKKLVEKGYGFISVADGEKDVFFHSKSLVGLQFNELQPGDVVNFEIEQGPREGLENAVDVQGNGLAFRGAEIRVVNSDEISLPASDSFVKIRSVRAITDHVVRHLRDHPSDLYQLHPKMFEELVAEILKSEGYSTELVGSWNQADGGVDIIAVRRDFEGFQLRYAIQCKRQAADRRITAEPIRALAGVMDRFRAHVGVIATTSYFTQPAREEVESQLWKVSLRDYESIIASLGRLNLVSN